MLEIPTTVLRVDPAQSDKHVIQRAAAIIRSGGLVAFPTETVYGLGANALDAEAVQRIFVAKGRPASDPLIVHIAASEQLDALAEDIPTLARTLAQSFWPGALTLVLKRRPIVPANVSAGRATVAIRMPNYVLPLALIRAAGVPIAAPSANLFSRPSPTLAAHVLEDLAGRIEMLLDGGATPIGVESTVLDLTQATPKLLRPGGVPIEALQVYIPGLRFEPQYRAIDDTTMSGPGMLLKHYSPRAELRLFTGERDRVLARMRTVAQGAIAQGQTVGIMALDEEVAAFDRLGAQVVGIGPQRDLALVAQHVFASMRQLDQQGVAIMLVRGFEREGMGLAIWDRLVRAAEGQVIEVV